MFFSGDTGLTTEYRAIRERLGPFDLVMLEVGAFHPAWGDIHLGPENALKAFALLGGGAFLPVHWGTFSLAMHAWDQPAETLLAVGAQGRRATGDAAPGRTGRAVARASASSPGGAPSRRTCASRRATVGRDHAAEDHAVADRLGPDLLAMDYLRHLFDEYGLPLVFVSVFMEQLGPPLPSGPLMIVAGALSVEGRLSATSVALVAWLSCMLGKIALFAFGARFGAKTMDSLCRVAMSPTTCVGRANHNFDRWGPALLLVAEFIPGMRTLAPALAGAEKIGVMRFLFYSAIGAALWTALYVGLGLAFSAQVDAPSHCSSARASTRWRWWRSRSLPISASSGCGGGGHSRRIRPAPGAASIKS